MDNLNMHYSPRFKKPVMLAAWPGVSNVALQVSSYLRNKLDVKEFAEIEPAEYFTPVGIQVEDNVAQVPLFPENKFYLFKTPKGKSDLIIFNGEAQPDHNQYELAHLIVDAARKFKVKRIYTCAAALVQHSVQKSRVLAAVTDPKLLSDLNQYDITMAGNFQIRGLNGLLLGVAKEKGVEGICVLGETPEYASEMPNPMACYALLDVLSQIFDLKLDLSDIAKEAEQTSEVMKALSQEMMVKYIDHFTQPIWERNPRDDYEDDDDDGDMFENEQN